MQLLCIQKSIIYGEFSRKCQNLLSPELLKTWKYCGAHYQYHMGSAVYWQCVISHYHPAPHTAIGHPIRRPTLIYASTMTKVNIGNIPYLGRKTLSFGIFSSRSWNSYILSTCKTNEFWTGNAENLAKGGSGNLMCCEGRNYSPYDIWWVYFSNSRNNCWSFFLTGLIQTV